MRSLTAIVVLGLVLSSRALSPSNEILATNGQSYHRVENDTIDLRVTVTAYCPCRRCCGRSSDGLYATGRKVKNSDYSFAVSRDLEPYLPLDGVSLTIPGYNPPGTTSVCRDRMARSVNRGGRRVPIVRTIDILMTVSKDGKTAHQRAKEWGVRSMTIRVLRDPAQ